MGQFHLRSRFLGQFRAARGRVHVTNRYVHASEESRFMGQFRRRARVRAAAVTSPQGACAGETPPRNWWPAFPTFAPSRQMRSFPTPALGGLCRLKPAQLPRWGFQAGGAIAAVGVPTKVHFRGDRVGRTPSGRTQPRRFAPTGLSRNRFWWAGSIVMTDISVVWGYPDSHIGHFRFVMPALPPVHSRLAREALDLLGKRIRLARKERRMSEKDLAARVGIARSTLQRIERGDPAVAIGRVFEAAVITGVDLFVPEATSLLPEIRRTEERLALMPAAVRASRRVVDDDF